MNHLLRSRQRLGSVPSRVLSRFYHSITPAQIPTSSLYTGDSLRHRILSRAQDRKASITPVLNQWLQESTRVNSNELQSLIRQLRQTRRFNHALEISDWLNDKKTQSVSPGSIAVRLDLISKVHGLEQAEKYFNNIPETMRPFELYGALLNCYVLIACFDYLEAQGEGKAEELLKLLQGRGYDELVNKIENRNLGKNTVDEEENARDSDDLEGKNARNDDDLEEEKQGFL